MTEGSAPSEDGIFIGANRQALALDYKANLVAYGAGTTVALWNPFSKNKRGVFHTLRKHSKEVTCVKFVPNCDELLSAGEDGNIALWKETANSFDFAHSVKEEEASITCMAVCDDKFFVTGNSLGKVSIYKLEGEEIQLHCQFDAKFNFYPLTLCIHKFGSTYLLLVGGTSPSLFVYTFSNTADVKLEATLAGHEDWIKALAVVKDGEDYLLASGSQDRYIRIWRLRFNDNIDNSDEDETKLTLLTNKQYKFNIGEDKAAFSFDALIMGHDDWVSGLRWHPHCLTNGEENKKLQLLSLSADTALMIWEMDEESGIWVCLSRLGEMSIKGASTATGSSGGFWSCLWITDEEDTEQLILANGKTGAIRAYKSTDEENKTWTSVLGVTGPTREVNDIVWSRDGSCFYATSLDQTSRLFAPWMNERPAESKDEVTWHEFARPQIHGYDMICLDHITPTKFVLGGDEKVLRVFEMTQSISNNLSRFCGINLSRDSSSALPEAAALPVLGLSNKAANEQLEAGEAQQREEDYEETGEERGENGRSDPLDNLEGPPLEDHLQRHTLFPEIEKLYGHGYEITCCATSPSGNLIASACRSNNARHAVIRIFNVKKDYKLEEKALQAHNLTITSLEFSKDGEYLVAVSRDRQLSLWRLLDDENATFELVQLNQKAHSRIVWDCSWVPTNSYGRFFVTASRDKSVKLWKVTEEGALMVAVLKTSEPVTAVACFQESLINNKLVLALGQESGKIGLFSVDLSETEPRIFQTIAFDEDISPASKVCKLSFSSQMENKKLLLAVASSDTSARIYGVRIQDAA